MVVKITHVKNVMFYFLGVDKRLCEEHDLGPYEKNGKVI